MAKCLPISNGILCIVETDFNCPSCGYQYDEKDYYSQLDKSRKGLIYKRCKGCNELIGITTDIKGDVRTWMKKDNKNLLK